MKTETEIREIFDEWIKYPSTLYLDFSPSRSKDSKDNFNLSNLLHCPLVITIKMDGSNFTMTNEHVAARNAWNAPHESFDMAKAEHSRIRFFIPDRLQLFGEWLYAKHTIHYVDNLELSTFLQLFSVYDKERKEFLDWQSVEEISKKIGHTTTPVISHGEIFETENELRKFIEQEGEKIISQGHEGIVVRVISSFPYSQFENKLAKYVRRNHVQTDQHWSRNKIVRNHLKNS